MLKNPYLRRALLAGIAFLLCVGTLYILSPSKSKDSAAPTQSPQTVQTTTSAPAASASPSPTQAKQLPDVSKRVVVKPNTPNPQVVKAITADTQFTDSEGKPYPVNVLSCRSGYEKVVLEDRPDAQLVNKDDMIFAYKSFPNYTMVDSADLENQTFVTISFGGNTELIKQRLVGIKLSFLDYSNKLPQMTRSDMYADLAGKQEFVDSGIVLYRADFDVRSIAYVGLCLIKQ